MAHRLPSRTTGVLNGTYHGVTFGVWSLAMTPSNSDLAELTARLDRIRKLCDDLDKAIGSADDQRLLLVQMKQDADAAYKALTKKF
jgi:hypothetical protein